MSFHESDVRYGQFTRVKKYLSSENNADNGEPDGVTESSATIDSLLSKINEEDTLVKRRVHHLNSLAKVIRNIGHDSLDFKYRIWTIIEELRYALSFGAKEVRAGVLRVLRYILASGEVFEIMLKLHVDFLVARSMDTPVVRDIERLQALRFIRQVVMLCPHKLPPSLVSPLVSVVLSDTEPPDTMTWSALATLSEIVIIAPELCRLCDIVHALQRGVLKCQIARISESVVLSLSHLYNHPDTRQYMRSNLDIQSLLAPLTDLHYRFLVDNIDSSYTKSFREKRVESAKMAVAALFKTWPGIISLCSYDMCGISSFVDMLPLVESYAQKEMLLVLYEIFQFQVPVWTEDYREAVASIDPSQYRDEWSLDNGWVAEEGKALLPPKVMERTNLLDCYNAFVLACFLQSNLFPSLVQVVKVSDPYISVMATILIGELLHLANSLLPAEYLGNSLSLPSLIAAAMCFNCQTERNRASEVINCLNQIHQLKKDTVKPSSLYLKLSLEQTGYFSGKTAVDTQKMMKIVFVTTEMDDVTLQSHIRDTQVLAVREFQSWNWNLIFSLLQHPYLFTASLAEDSMLGRFIRTLTNFYKPDNRQFSSIVFSNKNSQKYSLVGLQLVKNLSKMESSEDSLLLSLITDIVNQLRQVTASKLTSDVFSPSSISNKLSRDYFLMLGAVSFHNSAILKQAKAYGPLLDISGITSRHDLHKLIIASLDFAHDVQSRVILEKLLTSGDEVTRLYATRHMRVFLRLNAPLFISWGMEMLIGQLYDLSSEIAEEAIDILDEACEEESFLDVLVLQQPALLHLSEKGVALFTRFVSVKRGYAMLSDLGHLKNELTAWIEDYNFRYVSLVEQRLAESLTTYRWMKEGVYQRRSDTSGIVHKTFVPVHFYGQLVKQEEGCQLLRNEKHLERLAVFLRREPITAEEICQTKAAIWALGHIGTSIGGLSLLVEHNLIHDLVMTAENAPILSVRGTSYYAICLISKTSKGVDVLLSKGWTSVRHSKEEKWPVRFEEAIEEVSTPSSPLSPTSSLASLSSMDGSSDQQLFDGGSPLKSSSLSSVDTASPGPYKKSPSTVTRNASLAALPVKKGSLISRNYHLRPTRPSSLATMDQPETSSNDLSGSARHRFQRHTTRSSSGNLGIALPLQLQTLFMLEDVSSTARAHAVSTDIFDKDHNFILDGPIEDKEENIAKLDNKEGLDTPEEHKQRSSSPLVRQKRLSSQTTAATTSNCSGETREHKRDEDCDEDVSEMIKPHKASVVSHASVSSSTSGSVVFDENSCDGRKLLHRECLELVYNLSSDVSQKKNVMLLNMLFEKFPSLQEDVSLYWKTMLLLSTYPYKLNCRRFIQSKFIDLSFEKSTSKYQTDSKKESLSPKMRRRSSTSDMNKLIEKLEVHNSDSVSVTTVDEHEVLIISEEDTSSVSSGDVLDWNKESDGTMPSVPEDINLSNEDTINSKNNKPTTAATGEVTTLFVAEEGNRLSQLEISDDGIQKQMESVVEIAYDL